MRVVVAGAGKIGRYLASDLGRLGHDVVVVERSEDALDKIESEHVTPLLGDACALDVLAAAGAREADAVIAATGDDEDNLVISLLCKQEFAVPRVLARVNYPENEWLFDDAWGVDLAVSPPHMLTALVEEEVTAGNLVPLLKLQKGQVELLEVRLEETSVAVGQRVADLDLPPDVALFAVVRKGRVVPCRATTPLIEGDEVLALVAAGSREELREQLIGPVAEG
jgi:trk system potassium uptake protein